MRYRVEIVDEPKYEVMVDSMPKAKMGAQVNYSLYNKLASMGGADMEMSAPDSKATQTITKVPRKAANLEAEGGETVLTFDPVGYPLFYKIKGPRHHSGGVPLNLPDDSFIFSDTKEMIIRDCTILKMFNKACNKKGFTPADLSRQFDINTYRNTLQDPNTDEITRKTAESMIKKYVVKLGALALAQEAKKGFPQGIPVVAKAYMEAYGISEGDIMPELAEEEQQMPQQQGQGQMSPIDQMPPDQYAQEPQPEGAQYTQGDEMGQQAPVPEGMASPEMVEPMMQQMEQQQAPPMAMYGMSMGGFYPEYAFGGFPRFDGGGTVTINQSSSSSKITDPKALKKEYSTGNYKPGTAVEGRTYTPIGEGNIQGWGEKRIVEKEAKYEEATDKNYRGDKQSYIKDICNRMQNGDLKGLTAKQVIDVKRVILPEHPERADYESAWEGCQNVETVDDYQFIDKPTTTTTTTTTTDGCPDCIDPITGQAVTTGPDGQPFKRVKDANGNCTPCPTKGCYCEDEMGKEVEVDCNDPCLKEEQVESTVASYGPEVPFKSQSIDPVWADANMNPEYIGERSPQLELYGIDARPEANQAMAGANAIMQAQSKFASNPGALLANQLAGQAAASDITNAAYAAANKFNTNQRNDEIKINTNYRDQFLNKIPAAARQYLGEVAMQKENAARFWNETQAKKVERRDAKNKYDTEMNWVLANNENVKWAPDRGFYSRKTRDFTPNAPKSDMLSRTKQVMSEGIEDANTAYKIAKDMESRLGGAIYANGGFIYTDNIFPYLI
jgi:hypothetical protein